MAATIMNHLEYVAQLEAQMIGFPYSTVGEHTAALAKRALETDLVRLDETYTEQAETRAKSRYFCLNPFGLNSGKKSTGKKYLP